MPFYAIRVTCRTCHSEFLVGGAAWNDLSRWRGSLVECHSCGAEVVADEGTVVHLSRLVSEEPPGRAEAVGDPPRADEPATHDAGLQPAQR